MRERTAIFVLVFLFLSACTGKPAGQPGTVPTVRATDGVPTATPEPTATRKPEPTATQTPELALTPKSTLAPTGAGAETPPKPTATPTPEPTATPILTPVVTKSLADRILVCYEGEKAAREEAWLFCVEHNGKKGAINQYGEVVVEPVYDYLHDYSEGMAVFWSNQEKKYGFLDAKGNVVVPPIFDWVEDFSEDLAVVETNRLWGYIDKTGKYKIEPKYGGASSFSEGLAWAHKMIETEREEEGYHILITPEDEEVLLFPAQHAINVGSFHDGLAAVRFEYMLARYTGYMDQTGEVVFESDMYGREIPLREFSEGFVVLYVEKEDDGLNKMYLDVNGDILGGYEFEEAEDFSEGLAYAERDGICGYIDATGEFVLTGIDAGGVPCPFHGGLAACRKDGKYGFIDKTGEFVIAPVYDAYWGDGFENGYAVVFLEEVKICINEAGEEMWRLEPEK